MSAGDRTRPARGRVTPAGRTRRQAPDPLAERRRASRSLWAAVESLLSADAEPAAVAGSLGALQKAFDCDGVALYRVGAGDRLEPWCACGVWDTSAGVLRSCMSVPLSRGAERVGKLDLIARPGQRWRPGQLGLVRTAAGALGSALGARLELQRLRHTPGRDPVTGLPDAGAFRTRLDEELLRARRVGVPVAVVAVDLDHFSALTDRYGRETGDAVLSESALLLKLALREADLVARIGPDRFAVMLPETDRVAGVRCADRVRRSLEEHRFPRAGRVSVSAGVAAGPGDGLEAAEVIEQAQRAVSIAKKSGRRRVHTAGPQAMH